MRLLGVAKAGGHRDPLAKRSCLRVGGFFLCCAALALFPLIACLFFRADFVQIANESLAYRYFAVARFWHGKHGAVWLPQGFLISDFQHLIFWCLDRLAGLPVSDLRLRLNMFAVGTLAVNSLGLVVLFFFAARDALLRWSDKLLLAVVACVPMYGTVSLEFGYATWPDYLMTNVVLTSLSVYLFQRAWRTEGGERRLAAAAATGFFAGVAISNKISMAVIGLFPLGAVILAPQLSLGQFLWRVGIGLAGVAVGLVSVVWGFFLYDWATLRDAFPKWWEFVAAPGEQPFFWGRLPGILRAHNFDLVTAYVLASIICSGIVTIVMDRRDWRKLWLLAATVLGAGLCVLTVVKRPAETTLFDAGVFLLALSVIVVTTCLEERDLWRYAVCSTLFWAMVCASTFPWRDSLRSIEMSRQLGDASWGRHSEIREWAAGRPIVFVLPDNSYTASTVEELLLKGASEFPTWRIATEARWILQSYAPGLSFRTDYDLPRPDAGYPGNALLVWLDLAGTPTISQRYRGMAQALGRDGVICRRWFMSVTHTLNACALPTVQLRAPTSLRTKRIAPTRIELSWKAEPQVETYRIEMSRPPNGFREIGAVYFPADRYEVGAVSATAAYQFRILAQSGDAISPSSEVAEEPGIEVIPSAPTGLRGRRVRPTKIELRWMGDPAAGTWHIEIRRDDGIFEEIGAIPASSLRHDVTHVPPDATYAFRICSDAGKVPRQCSTVLTIPPWKGGPGKESKADELESRGLKNSP